MTVTSNDKIKFVENTKVPIVEEKQHVDEITIRSYTSSMKPKSDKNEKLIMTHIPVQKMNDAKYTLPENQEKEWVNGVLIDKPVLNLDTINDPPKDGTVNTVAAPNSTVLFPNPYGIKKTLNGHKITPSTLTAARPGYKLEPLKVPSV